MAEVCEGCQLTDFQAIARFFENNVESVQFLRDHGAITSSVNCGNCGNLGTLRKDKPIWQCNFRVKIPKTKRKKKNVTFPLVPTRGVLSNIVTSQFGS